jgi:hypothetical protein
MSGARAWAALLRKELRQLLPLALALAALVLYDACEHLLIAPPDANLAIFRSWLMGATDGGSEAVGLLIFGVFAAYNLFPGEHDQRTIELLYTLPVRRRTVFLTKYAAAVGLLSVWLVAGAVTPALSSALDPGSFARAQAAQAHLAREIGLEILMVAMAVAYGMLVSFFRGLGWVLAAIVWLGLFLVERISPSLEILGFSSLAHVEHDGTTPILRWRAWLLHAGMSAVALAVAARLWLGRQEAFAAFYERLRARRRLWRVVMALALTAAVLATVGLVVPKSGAGKGPSAGVESDLGKLETKHVQFTYRPIHEAQARFLAGDADQSYARVRDWLRAPEIGTVIADLTDESTEHVGLAGWQKLRIDVRPPKPRALLRFVFHHELTHVFAAALDDGISEERGAEARFFQEGLANHVAYDLLGAPEMRAHDRLIAAAARSQFQISFEDLLDLPAFVARYDEHLIYDFGELWVASLVATCGQSAPERLLRALGNSAGPQKLRRRSLWRHALQQGGCDIDRVLARYERQLASLESASRELPVASAHFVRQEGALLVFEVQAQVGVSAGSRSSQARPVRIVVRARGSARTSPDQIQSAFVSTAVGVRSQLSVPRPAIAGDSFQFQVGASRDEQEDSLFTRWETTTLEGSARSPEPAPR